MTERNSLSGPSGSGARRSAGRDVRPLACGAPLATGLVGTAPIARSMLESGRGRRVPASLGLERVADRWQDVLSLPGLPSPPFFGVLSVRSASELRRGRGEPCRSRAGREGGRCR